MRVPPLPHQESERLADLHDYGVLDTPADPVLDEIARLAAAICGTHYAAITLVDKDRQWFRAEHRLSVRETSRDESICGHAVAADGFFEVPDARADERFTGNPLLEGELDIRFYGGSPLRSSAGRNIGMLCVLDRRPRHLDEEQRLALQQLSRVVMALFEAHRQQRVIQWFSRVVDTVADEIFITDARTFRYVYANASAQRSLGYGIDELRRMTPMEVTPGLTRETFAGYVDQLRAGARQVVYEGVRRRSDGHVFPVEIRAQLLSAGGQEALVSTAHDISERKAMETLKDQFISVVNHELRTPLTSIHGAVKLLEHGAAGSLPPKAAELVRLAGLNTERLKRIVDDILDLEKIAAGRMTLDMQSLDAGEVLQAVAESQQAAASVAQVALDVQAAAGLRLRADPQRLQQALGNLVSNALKFAPRDTTVVLQAAARGGWVRLSVLDRGPGVPESFRDRIFQRFAQADMDRTRSKGGSGLGLSIVRSLTEQMRGRAGYESVPGRTEFHLDFPMEKD